MMVQDKGASVLCSSVETVEHHDSSTKGDTIFDRSKMPMAQKVIIYKVFPF